MDGLLTFLLFAGFFYLMMRYGCGAHMVHGHSHNKEHTSKKIDPVCGMEVKEGQGYSNNYAGVLYHFCSRKCLDKFDDTPSKYSTNNKGEEQ